MTESVGIPAKEILLQAAETRDWKAEPTRLSPAYYYRIHDTDEHGSGWGIRCEEHGELGGGPGFDKMDALLGADWHDKEVHGV